MTPKNIDALRSSLTERLPDFAKPSLTLFEAMVRADERRRAAVTAVWTDGTAAPNVAVETTAGSE